MHTPPYRPPALRRSLKCGPYTGDSPQPVPHTGSQSPSTKPPRSRSDRTYWRPSELTTAANSNSSGRGRHSHDVGWLWCSRRTSESTSTSMSSARRGRRDGDRGEDAPPAGADVRALRGDHGDTRRGRNRPPELGAGLRRLRVPGVRRHTLPAATGRPHGHVPAPPGRKHAVSRRSAERAGEAGELSPECALAHRPGYADVHLACRRLRDIPLPHGGGLLLVHRCACHHPSPEGAQAGAGTPAQAAPGTRT